MLLLLKDGSHIELTQATDVIHKLGFLVCVDRLDTPVMTFPVSEVIAYTHNDKLAEELAVADDTEIQEVRPSTRRRSNRFKRHTRASQAQDYAPSPESVETPEHSGL